MPYGVNSPYGVAGSPYPPPNAYLWSAGVPAPSNDGMATGSLITGLLSVVGFCMWPVAIVLGIVAVVLGTAHRGKVRRGEATGGGHALAGIICGSVGAALGTTLMIALIATDRLV